MPFTVWLIAALVICSALALLLIEERHARMAKIGRGRIMEYWSGEERRASKRIETSLEVKYVLGSDKDAQKRARTGNISMGGLKLIIAEKLSVGAVLLLDIIFPGKGHPVLAEGRVVWVHGDFAERDEAGRRVFFTGVQLLNFQPSHNSRLSEYMNELEARR